MIEIGAVIEINVMIYVVRVAFAAQPDQLQHGEQRADDQQNGEGQVVPRG